MKELNSFTVERLEELSTKENIPELAALARIALAAKRAKPVAYWNDACDLDDGAFSYANDAGRTRPLYTTPQLSPAPSAWEINGILCHTKREADNYSGKKTPLYEALS